MGTLYLSHNKIGDIGVTAISNVLKTNTVLAELRLFNNHIGVAGANALAGMLKLNTSLTSLNINANPIGEEGCIKFAEALKENTPLKKLYMDRKYVSQRTQQVLLLTRTLKPFQKNYLQQKHVQFIIDDQLGIN